MRSSELLSRTTSRLVVVDMQEKLLNAMLRGEAVTAACVRLLKGAQLLQIPTDVTEQYPKGLGPTVDALQPFIEGLHEKLRFSAAEVLPWLRISPGNFERHQVVLAGIEAHVCIQQTALDLLAAGFRVFLAADACCSRHDLDRDFARKRMSDSGVIITTVEAILFEWCETADAAEFKQMSKIVTGKE